MKSEKKNSDWLRKLEEEGHIQKKTKAPDQLVLLDDLIWVWEAFLLLSSGRTSNSEFFNPIQISEILSYCTITGISSLTECSFLMNMIKIMDQVWLDHHEELREKARRKNAKAHGTTHPKVRS